VVVFARQHPGESVGSWMMEGLANRLVEMPASDILWVLVPMINPDGVSLGNNRTGVLGFDFNRHWYIDKVSHRSHLFPELIGIIRYFKTKQRDYNKKLKIFIDFHGHSSQSNVFAYGPPHSKQS
jgi:cytosolic carboxypeptidase protein 2/3